MDHLENADQFFIAPVKFLIHDFHESELASAGDIFKFKNVFVKKKKTEALPFPFLCIIL